MKRRPRVKHGHSGKGERRSCHLDLPPRGEVASEIHFASGWGMERLPPTRYHSLRSCYRPLRVGGGEIAEADLENNPLTPSLSKGEGVSAWMPPGSVIEKTNRP